MNVEKAGLPVGGITSRQPISPVASVSRPSRFHPGSSPLLVDTIEDGKALFGAEESPNIVKRLEEKVGSEILAPGFPAAILDDEPAQPGYEVIPILV